MIPKACIAVPTIRERSISEFLAAWKPQFRDHHVIVVEDNPHRTFALPDWVVHVSWGEIDADLKEDAWIIPRRSGAIRNYGILLAARYEPDMIVMLDDDCLPTECDDFLEKHWRALETPGTEEPLFDTLSVGRANGQIRPRGFPKDVQYARTVLNHGLWNGVPDLDGETQAKQPYFRTQFVHHSVQVPPGTLFPLCAMNVAFRPEILPAMYQPLMGQGQPFNRFDDIWCGWVMKKACDCMGLSVRSGAPFVEHTRASDARKNAEVEAPGIVENEKVWRAMLKMNPSSGSLYQCLEEIHAQLKLLGPYWERVARAAAAWRSHVFEVR